MAVGKQAHANMKLKVYTQSVVTLQITTLTPLDDETGSEQTKLGPFVEKLWDGIQSGVWITFFSS